VRQAGQISIGEQFAPALEIERGLSLEGMELDRQGIQQNFILLIRVRQACGPSSASGSAKSLRREQALRAK